MAWRVIEHDGRPWRVSLAAERRANAPYWSLVFSFRPEGTSGRTIWATHELSSASRGALFAQAERLPDEALVELLGRHLA